MDAIFAWFTQLKWDKLLEMVLVALSCIVCIVFHEVCHGLAAMWMGDNTARRAGRLSLNPLKHIDPIGLVMLFTVHFGWAKPVPVDMRRFRNPKAGMALTALAGPVGNLLLAAVLMPLYALCVYRFHLTQSDWAYYSLLFLINTVSLSIGLGIFNLFPIPPLDGSKILFAVLPPRLYLKLMRYERYGMLLLVALLFFGVLDAPLSFLRDGVMNGLLTLIAEPVLQLLAVWH